MRASSFAKDWADQLTADFTWDPTGIGSVIADGEEYARGLGLISRITSGNAATYAHQDGLGSVRLLTDSTAAVVGTGRFDAFGASRVQSGARLAFSYTGEQSDAESGLVYLRARYLDPATGRFLSQDLFPGWLDELASLHSYSYTANNPERFTDPSGRCYDPDAGRGGWRPAVAACRVDRGLLPVRR